MAITQRDEFASVIQRGGGRVEALLASLRDKVGQR
jgi:phospholipid transport system substrate-binding protein